MVCFSISCFTMLTPEQSYIKSVWKQGVNRILLNFDFNFVFIKKYIFYIFRLF